MRTTKTYSYYLDNKTSEINFSIEKDTRLIEFLKKRIALINHVVIQGLDPDMLIEGFWVWMDWQDT